MSSNIDGLFYLAIFLFILIGTLGLLNEMIVEGAMSFVTSALLSFIYVIHIWTESLAEDEE